MGRGATDPDANAEVAKVSRLLQSTGGFATVGTSFFPLTSLAVLGDLRMNRDTYTYRVLLPGFGDELGQPQTPHHPDDPTGQGHGHGHGHGHAH